MKNTKFLAIAIALIMISALLLTPVSAKPSGTVNVQVLALNDFHGNLIPPTSSSGCVPAVSGCPAPNVPAGGVEYLATHISNLRALNPNTVVGFGGRHGGCKPVDLRVVP